MTSRSSIYFTILLLALVITPVESQISLGPEISLVSSTTYFDGSFSYANKIHASYGLRGTFRITEKLMASSRISFLKRKERNYIESNFIGYSSDISINWNEITMNLDISSKVIEDIYAGFGITLLKRLAEWNGTRRDTMITRRMGTDNDIYLGISPSIVYNLKNFSFILRYTRFIGGEKDSFLTGTKHRGDLSVSYAFWGGKNK